MADRREERDRAEAISEDEEAARRGQQHDAGRIHRELAATARLTRDIDKLLGTND